MATTEVAQGPSGAAHQGELWLALARLDKRLQSCQTSFLEHKISKLCTVACNVAQRAHSLLANIMSRRGEQLNEFRRPNPVTLKGWASLVEDRIEVRIYLHICGFVVELWTDYADREQGWPAISIESKGAGNL